MDKLVETPNPLAFHAWAATPGTLGVSSNAAYFDVFALPRSVSTRPATLASSAFSNREETPRLVALLKGSDCEIVLCGVHFVRKFLDRVKKVKRALDGEVLGGEFSSDDSLAPLSITPISPFPLCATGRLTAAAGTEHTTILRRRAIPNHQARFTMSSTAG